MKVLTSIFFCVLVINFASSLSLHKKSLNKLSSKITDDYVNANAQDSNVKAAQAFGIQEILQNLRDKGKIDAKDNFVVSDVSSVQQKTSGSTTSYKFVLQLDNGNGSTVDATFEVASTKNNRYLSEYKTTIYKKSAPKPKYPLLSELVQPVYRAWNGGLGDHFYCLDPNREGSAASGWSPEGVAFCSFRTQLSGTLPFYRLWNGGWRDHFYTANQAEADNAANNLGFSREGHIGYIFSTQTSVTIRDANGNTQTVNTVPLYRHFNGGNLDHFYTTSATETQSARGIGWGYEGIAGYVVQSC